MNILRNIENGFTALWARISGITSEVADKITGIIVIEYALVILFSVLTLLGVLFNLVTISFFVALLASIIIIICYASSEAALGALAAIADIVLLGRRKVTTIVVDEVERVLRPLVVISLIFAFISCVVIISGTEFITAKLVMITLGAGTFYFVFYNFVLKSRTNKLELWMAIIIAWLLVENVILPNQVRPLTSFGRTISEWVSTSVNKSGQKKSLRIVKAGATLYDKDFNAIRKTSADVTVKFLSFESFDNTKEDFNKVTFPDKNGDYLRGETVLVSVRYIENFHDNEETEQPNYNSQVNYKKNSKVEEETYLIPAKGNDTIPLSMRVGDKVEYSSTDKFETLGTNQWWPINGYANHRCTSNEPAIVRSACGKPLSLTVRVTHK